MKISNHIQKGITLVEVLAGIVIISIIVTSLFGIMADSQKQYSNQSERNHGQQNVSYALKVLTREIRQNPDSVVFEPNKKNEISINGTIYVLDNGELKRNSVSIANNIEKFEVGQSEDGTISITIQSKKGEEVSTEIAQRS